MPILAPPLFFLCKSIWPFFGSSVPDTEVQAEMGGGMEGTGYKGLPNTDHG